MDDSLIIWIGKIVMGLAAVAVFIGLFQWLWNITVPEVFRLKRISFWQAFRIMLLAGILFGAGGIRFIF